MTELERLRAQRLEIQAKAERERREAFARGVHERAARNATLLPSGRAIVWIWLALLVLLIPFWGH
jgi:hypothetical protein